MSIVTTQENLVYLILLGIGAPFIVAVLFGVWALIVRLFRFEGGVFGVVYLVTAVVGGLFALSLYVDVTGQPAVATVTSKSETVELREEGDWRYHFSALLSFTNSQGQDASVTLNLKAEAFDSLHEGDSAELRVAEFTDWLSMARLATLSTRTWLPWGWIMVGLAFAVLVYLVYRLFSSAGCLVLAILVAAGAFGSVSYRIYSEWRQSEDFSRATLAARAKVLSITHVTRIDPLPCEGGDCTSSEFDVPQQYDIVQMSFVPQGYRDQVTAVDAVDTPHALRLEKGGSVDVVYAPDAPRSARIPGQTHSHHWKNAVGFVGNVGLGAMAIGVIMALIWAIGRLPGLFLRRAAP